MSMVDNYADTITALRRFIHAHHPGATERSLASVETSSTYFSLEFRRERMGCTLYIEVGGFSHYDSVTDDEGNRWGKYKLSVKPSWPSYGSVDIEDAVRFAKLLEEVNTFASALEFAFATPIVKLVETAAQIAARKQKAAEDKCRADVQARIRANMKGMRVGQERHVECPDLLPVGEVTVCDGPRHYTANVTSNRAFFFTRTA